MDITYDECYIRSLKRDFEKILLFGLGKVKSKFPDQS
jgi:hypothetical protein